MIKDRNIGYKYKKDWFPATGFNSLEVVVDDESGGAATEEATATLNGAVGGAPPLVEIGALGVTGAIMDTAGDFLRMTLPMPGHWDLDNDIHFRVLWSDGATNDAHTITWKVMWRTFEFQSAPSAGDVAIEIDADANSTVANSLDASPWGKLSGGTWAGPGEDFLVLDVECDVDGNNLDPIFVGLEVAYLPKLTSGAQNKLTPDPEDA